MLSLMSPMQSLRTAASHLVICLFLDNWETVERVALADLRVVERATLTSLNGLVLTAEA